MKTELDKLKREIASIKSDRGDSATKLRYPDKIKDAALRLFRSQSEMTANGFANEIGISNTAIVSWLRRSAKEAPRKGMIPLKIQSSADHPGKQKPKVLPPARVMIFVIEGDESGLQLDRIFRGLKITEQLVAE